MFIFSDDDARELLTYVIIPDCVTVYDIFFALRLWVPILFAIVAMLLRQSSLCCFLAWSIDLDFPWLRL